MINFPVFKEQSLICQLNLVGSVLKTYAQIQHAYSESLWFVFILLPVVPVSPLEGVQWWGLWRLTLREHSTVWQFLGGEMVVVGSRLWHNISLGMTILWLVGARVSGPDYWLLWCYITWWVFDVLISPLMISNLVVLSCQVRFVHSCLQSSRPLSTISMLWM